VQRVRAGGQRYGLLLSMTAGYEHIHRRYDLVVVLDGKLRLAWSALEPQGPAASSVEVRSIDAERDELLFMSTYQNSESGEADELEFTRVRYDASKNKYVESKLGCDPGLHMLSLRRFTTLDAAIAAREKPCRGGVRQERYSIAGALALKAPRGRGFVLAQVSTDPQTLSELEADAVRCRPELKPERLTWCPKP
jgi:hypothetical protein